MADKPPKGCFSEDSIGNHCASSNRENNSSDEDAMSSASSTGPQGCKFDHQYIRFCTDGRSLDRYFLVHI